MKSILLFALAFLFTTQVSMAQTVSIPDTNFEQALITLGIDNNGLNGNILLADAMAITSLNVGSKNIYDLTGIEAFVNLLHLYCNGNHLSNLDVSSNINLTILQCTGSQLTSLNLQSNVNLKQLHVGNNSLMNLDVSANTALELLSCGYNNFTSLNVSNNLLLKNLNCYNGNLNMLNISNNGLLEDLELSKNNLRGLDASNNDSLTKINVAYNQLTSFNLKNGRNTKIVEFSSVNNPGLICVEVDDAAYSIANWSGGIDAQTSFSSSCPTIAIPDINFEQALINLGYDSNGLTGDILESEAAAVTLLDVSNQSIQSLQGIEGFVGLTVLRCQDNNLTSLDVSNSPYLKQLNCRNNQLSSLAVTANALLEILNCYSNQIDGLDLSKNIALKSMLCDNNDLEYLNVKNGNNTNITLFGALNNPNLTCIVVDNIAYSNANWSAGVDAQTSFNVNCGQLAISETNFPNEIIFFPNPSEGNFYIKGTTQPSEINIFDINGRLILHTNVRNNEAIDLTHAAPGLYFIHISSRKKNSVNKLIVQ